MFRTIERTLIFLTLLLIAATTGTAWLFADGKLFLGVAAAFTVLWLTAALSRTYKKINSNFIFLLNALENGDYSFSFAETDTSRARRDVNSILNVIKDILSKARQDEIENEKFLSLIVALMPAGIVIIDERDFVIVANDAALRLLGMHVFTHVKQLEMVDVAVLQAFRGLTPGRKTTVRIADECEERLVSLGMSRISIKRGTLCVITMYNIANEFEEYEMESWIKLIRVMTHEIMNSIAPITSLSETMFAAYNEAETGADMDRLRCNTMDAFGTINSTARGLLSFVESYRRFAGIPKPELRPVALAQFVGNIVRLESPGLSLRGIEINTRFDDLDIAVAADESQIGQVLVNLFKNAAEAIPSDLSAGCIEVRVWSDSDGAVHIEVSSNGDPIPEEVLPHIFVPFFTTKQSGTGIGLSISRHIMRLHGGNLKHYASVGRTSFCMVFPPRPDL